MLAMMVGISIEAPILLPPDESLVSRLLRRALRTTKRSHAHEVTAKGRMLGRATEGGQKSEAAR
jgi:hypothetical protein